MHTDYLIVGQGIAGSVFAEHCLMRGSNICVISESSFSNSSLVAGGLYNPITGRKMVKTWNCDQLFDYLIPFYQELEKKLAAHILHDLPIYRPFADIEAQNEWMGRSAEQDFEPYVERVFFESNYAGLFDPFGGVLLKKSGYLDTKKFVEAYGVYLDQAGIKRRESFDIKELILTADGVKYKDITAKAVVFCEGSNVRVNQLFNWLPFRPVKGELLTIRTKHKPEVIYNRGVFVIGKENGLCTVGATYDHTDLSTTVTEKGKEQLEDKLNKLVNFDYEVIDQKAGIRPATKDRRPLIGEHPEMKNVYIFNGLGAKGVSLAPFYAKQLVDHLIDGSKLDAEVNIERYFSLF